MLKKSENKKIAVLLAIIFFVIVCFLVVSHQKRNKNIASVEIKNHIFFAEVVSENKDLEKGLSGQRELCSSCGMIFEFQKKGIYSFWMNDMLIPLDIAWISDGMIVHIEKNVQATFAGTMTPIEKSDIVLEIGAGKLDEFGIEVGDRVKIQ